MRNNNILRTSTSLALILSMTVPVPTMAQEVTTPCGPEVEAPCLLEDGTVLTVEAAEAAAAEAEAAKAAEDAAALEQAAQAEAEAAKAAEDAAALEQAAQAEAEAAKAAEDAAALEQAAQAEAEAAKAAEDAAALEQAAQAEAEAEAAKAAEDAAALEQAAQAEAEAAKAAEESAPDTADATTAAEPQPIVVEEPETIISEDTGLTEEAAAAEAETVAAAEQEAPTAAAAAASDDATAAITEEPEVTVTTVTEDDVRSSDQDFAPQKAASKTKPKTKNKDKADNKTKDEGLSDLQKILLAAGGAAVVGAILNNGSKVVQNTGDRVVAQRDDGSIYVLKDDDALVRRPGSTVETQTYSDGSSITTVTKASGEKVLTIRDAQGRVLRRSRVMADGREYLLFDDTVESEKVDVSELPRTRADRLDYADQDAALEAALNRELGYDVGRRFSLSQIRNIRAVRELVPQIDLEAITFDTGSAAIRASEAQKLARLGRAMQQVIEDRPNEVFLIEGHTDAVGSAVYNLTLSDRRAESLALALTEYFDIPPENLVVQGYGEGYLKVASDGDVRANRRVAVRRITPLLGMQTASR